MDSFDVDIRVELAGCLFGYKSFRTLYVLFLKQELSVEIGQVYRVEVNLWKRSTTVSRFISFKPDWEYGEKLRNERW